MRNPQSFQCGSAADVRDDVASSVVHGIKSRSGNDSQRQRTRGEHRRSASENGVATLDWSPVGLAHVQRDDRPEVVDEADDAPDDADQREPAVSRVDRRLEQTELGEKATEGWDPGEREHANTEGERADTPREA